MAAMVLVGLVSRGSSRTYGVVASIFIGAHFASKRRAAKPPRLSQLTNSVYLGEDEQREPVLLTDRQLAAHGLIVGASGRGRRRRLLRILCEAIARGWPVIAIDLKGSHSFGAQLSAAAARRPGGRCTPWRLDGPAHWNPLQYGDASS